MLLLLSVAGFLAALSPPAFSEAARPASPPAAPLTVDLDGDATPESVTAVSRGKKVQLEIRAGSARKVIAETSVPVPGNEADEVLLSAGSLASAGALLEVVAASGENECRSVWRFRDRSLSRVPVGTSAQPVAECGKRGEWSYGWDRPQEDAPAEYRRERTRETPDGPHHQVESFRYAGFRLEPDPARTMSEVRGIAIPSWFGARLYRKTSLDGLYARYDLSQLKTGARLRFVTDPAAGVFSVRLDTAAGERLLPVTGRQKGPGRNEVVLSLGSDSPPRKVLVTLAGGTVPGEAVLSGFGPELDGLYTPAMRITDGALRVFATAEDELAVNGLVGSWASEKGEAVAIVLASSEPVLLEIGKSRYQVNVERAPAGIDALFLPGDGTAPTSGILLRGPNAFTRVPIRCEGVASDPRECRSQGPGELLHRVGARLNSR